MSSIVICLNVQSSHAVATNQDVRILVNTSSERIGCRFTAGCSSSCSCSVRYSTSVNLDNAVEDSSSVCEDGAVTIQLSAGLSDKDYYYEVTAVSGASAIIFSGSVVMTTGICLNGTSDPMLM